MTSTGEAAKPLRILQIGKFFDPDTGGIERVTQDLSYGLLEHGVQADVLCLSQRASYPAYHAPFQVYRCPSTVEIGGRSISLSYAWQIARLWPHYDAALVHVPNPLAMLAVNLFWRKPFALFWHADVVTMPRLSPLLRPLERWSGRQADMVIGATPAHVGGSYIADVLQPKSQVAAYPFDGARLAADREVTPAVQKIADFAAGRPLILAVGRLVEYKGFRFLIESAKHLQAPAAICVVGTGVLQHELQAAIEAHGVGDRVIMAGGMSDPELSALLQMAQIATMPSINRAEMYGVAQVEAMGMGKPVVSTSIPDSGVSWVNRHDVSGLIVPPEDAAALAAAFDTLLTHPELYARLANGAKHLFDTVYSSTAASGRYARLLRALARREAPAPDPNQPG
jgi:glycosyltransferase involved in cell wall biosynthesis